MKIEITLNEPLTKAKSKLWVFGVFAELNLNDDDDLESINYLMVSQLVKRIIFYFKETSSKKNFKN